MGGGHSSCVFDLENLRRRRREISGGSLSQEGREGIFRTVSERRWRWRRKEKIGASKVGRNFLSSREKEGGARCLLFPEKEKEEEGEVSFFYRNLLWYYIANGEKIRSRFLWVFFLGREVDLRLWGHSHTSSCFISCCGQQTRR